MYRAVISYGCDTISETFRTISDAEHWIDSNNNNYEYISYIQELDQDYKVRDWFYYTR